jgi:hypothetical protein
MGGSNETCISPLADLIVGLVKMISNPLLNGLRRDARFITIVHKAKLPE